MCFSIVFNSSFQKEKTLDLIMARNRRLAKPIPVMGTKLVITGFGRDTNGNSVVRVKNRGGGRGFSIQTNGNLPSIHRNIGTLRSGPVPKFITREMAMDIEKHIRRYGTDRQKMLSTDFSNAYYSRHKKKRKDRKYNAMMKRGNAVYAVGQDGQISSVVAVKTGGEPFKDSYVKQLSTLDGFEGVYLKSGQVGLFTEGDKWVGLTVSKQSPPRRVYIAGEKVKKSNPNYKNKTKLRIGKTR